MTMAAAYGVFANGGYYYKPHLITKIVDSTGAVIVDNTSVQGKRVISKETADKMTSMMLGTFSNGTGVSASPYGFTIAGKTGTTETNFDASKVNDQWIVGYTPDMVLSTWLGFEHVSEDHYLTGTSGQVVGKIFKAEAESLLPYSQGTQTIDDFAESAKEGMKEFGSKIKEGTKELFGGLWNSISGN